MLLFFAFTSAGFDINTKCSREGSDVVWIKKFHKQSRDLDTINFVSLFNVSGNELGRGAFGVVRKVNIATVFQKPKGDTDYDLAVKRVVKSELQSGELEVLEKLKDSDASPGFYACIVSTDRRHVYLVQELLSQTLEHFSITTKIRTKPVSKALSYFKTLFDAIMYMYRMELVHNDIKPANLMTDPTVSRAFLIDFGLAQNSSPKVANNGGGTPLFMSFNRFNGRRSNIMDDFYAAALSIGVIYGSIDKIFKTVPDNPKRIRSVPRECFQPPLSMRYHPTFDSIESLEKFCVNTLKQNTVNALRDKFGPDESDLQKSDMNFTTLLAKIINYVKSGIRPEEVEKTMNKLTKPADELIPEPNGFVKDADLQKSQALENEHKNLYKKYAEFQPIDAGNAEVNFALKDQRKKEREAFLKEIDALERKEKDHIMQSKMMKENDDLFKRVYNRGQENPKEEAKIPKDKNAFGKTPKLKDEFAPKLAEIDRNVQRKLDMKADIRDRALKDLKGMVNDRHAQNVKDMQRQHGLQDIRVIPPEPRKELKPEVAPRPGLDDFKNPPMQKKITIDEKQKDPLFNKYNPKPLYGQNDRLDDDRKLDFKKKPNINIYDATPINNRPNKIPVGAAMDIYGQNRDVYKADQDFSIKRKKYSNDKIPVKPLRADLLDKPIDNKRFVAGYLDLAEARREADIQERLRDLRAREIAPLDHNLLYGNLNYEGRYQPINDRLDFGHHEVNHGRYNDLYGGAGYNDHYGGAGYNDHYGGAGYNAHLGYNLGALDDRRYYARLRI